VAVGVAVENSSGAPLALSTTREIDPNTPARYTVHSLVAHEFPEMPQVVAVAAL